MIHHPGKLLASGRDGDIYEYEPGLVLRKTRDGRSIAHEARIMQYVADHGYPVPRVHEVSDDGTEIVMERIDGPLMLETGLARQPRMLRLLADLHDQLHDIKAPEWVRVLDEESDRLLHLDLHPLNVIMSPTRGPVVIDWPNAARGDPLNDVALTYVLLTCGDIPLPRPVAMTLNAIRRPMVDSTFARRYRGARFDARVAFMAELKMLDPNMGPAEIAAMQRLKAKKVRKALG